jgi:hypothetical protein
VLRIRIRHILSYTDTELEISYSTSTRIRNWIITLPVTKIIKTMSVSKISTGISLKDKPGTKLLKLLWLLQFSFRSTTVSESITSTGSVFYAIEKIYRYLNWKHESFFHRSGLLTINIRVRILLILIPVGMLIRYVCAYLTAAVFPPESPKTTSTLSTPYLALIMSATALPP